ncbi:MAG: hypothetical protein ACRD5R_00625 [Candidatus Acidiferrales bacterium]
MRSEYHHHLCLQGQKDESLSPRSSGKLISKLMRAHRVGRQLSRGPVPFFIKPISLYFPKFINHPKKVLPNLSFRVKVFLGSNYVIHYSNEIVKVVMPFPRILFFLFHSFPNVIDPIKRWLKTFLRSLYHTEGGFLLLTIQAVGKLFVQGIAIFRTDVRR